MAQWLDIIVLYEYHINGQQRAKRGQAHVDVDASEALGAN